MSPDGDDRAFESGARAARSLIIIPTHDCNQILIFVMETQEAQP